MPLRVMRDLAAVLPLFTVPCVAQLLSGTTFVNDPEYIALINNVHKSTWLAASQQLFNGLTFDDARRLHLSSTPTLHRDAENSSTYGSFTSGNFDARKWWPGLIQPIRTQQVCGSCWVISAATVLSDRISIAEGVASPVLSGKDMITCNGLGEASASHALSAIWAKLTNVGVATESCVPSAAMVSDIATSRCPTQCVGNERFQRTRAASSYAIVGAADMQNDIVRYGPIQAAFAVYKSFLVYSAGVYQKHFWETVPEGGHAVRILGWGTHKRQSFWLAANSWAETWGEKGYFRIVRGEGSCGIEVLGPPRAGLPAVRTEDFLA